VLIASGADVNKTDRTGATPLFMAVSEGNALIAKKLIDAKADTEIKLLDSRPIDVAQNKNNQEMINLLEKSGSKLKT
jgi:ankyrin repeat protein